MPTYDYHCDSCQHNMEVFQSIKEPRLTLCPQCGQKTLRRLIGAGAGIIFKGSGFYETDYKKKREIPKESGTSTSSSSADVKSK